MLQRLKRDERLRALRDALGNLARKVEIFQIINLVNNGLPEVEGLGSPGQPGKPLEPTVESLVQAN